MTSETALAEAWLDARGDRRYGLHVYLFAGVVR